MSCAIIDSMKHTHITQKGVSLIVKEDGSIWRPAFQSSTKRVRAGIEQEFVCDYQEKQLAQCKNKNGYLEVCVKQDGKRVKLSVHRLIGLAFVNGYQEGLTINHINGNKTDNRIENLEWVSLADNTKHQWATGLVNLRGENQPGHKLTAKQVIHIRKALKAGISANSLSIIAGVNPSTIYLIEKGKRWSHLD